jgi:hypothetical protein
MKTRHKAAVAYFIVLSIVCFLAFTRTFPVYISNLLPYIACTFELIQSNYLSFVEYLSHSPVIQELYQLFPTHSFFSYFPVHEHSVTTFSYKTCVAIFFNQREPSLWDSHFSEHYLLAILLPFWAPLIVPLTAALKSVVSKK